MGFRDFADGAPGPLEHCSFGCRLFAGRRADVLQTARPGRKRRHSGVSTGFRVTTNRPQTIYNKLAKKPQKEKKRPTPSAKSLQKHRNQFRKKSAAKPICNPKNRSQQICSPAHNKSASQKPAAIPARNAGRKKQLFGPPGSVAIHIS